MQLGKEDHAAISAAIHAAETRTNGQIVCVLAHSSSDYAHVPILWATALALVAPWPLIVFTPWSVQRIFLIQLAVFIVAGLLFTLTPLRFALVPRAALRARAHRAALEQFVVRRIAHTKNRTGILIFVSLAERYARIIADEGIAQKVPNSEWQAAIDAMVSHMRSGQIAAGFTAAIERCGTVLAAHAPPNGSIERIARSALRHVGARVHRSRRCASHADSTGTFPAGCHLLGMSVRNGGVRRWRKSKIRSKAKSRVKNKLRQAGRI